MRSFLELLKCHFGSKPPVGPFQYSTEDAFLFPLWPLEVEILPLDARVVNAWRADGSSGEQVVGVTIDPTVHCMKQGTPVYTRGGM